MKKFANTIMVALDDQLSDWLNEKVSQGYKKATFIRKVLEDYRKAEVIRNGNASSN
jgi:hypothetical protein